jgi:hypothetical protein
VPSENRRSQNRHVVSFRRTAGENEVATLKKQLRERGKKRSKGAGEAILRLGEQIGERLKGSNIALSDFVLQNRADQF